MINLLSPISHMPFGAARGELIWNLPINTVSWLKRQELTEDAKETLEDAWQLFLNEGRYAVLRRDAEKVGKVRLVLICGDYKTAKETCGKENEFVYYISSKTVVEYEKAS